MNTLLLRALNKSRIATATASTASTYLSGPADYFYAKYRSIVTKLYKSYPSLERFDGPGGQAGSVQQVDKSFDRWAGVGGKKGAIGF
ncbi:hypothetical protein QUB00_32295 [Microcoleus sp. F8_C2]